ncbi:MAG: hypothetical protein MZU79_02160 [Anaerotruncus sp.]|nr:hypothetical protein [Anaerotruncus sp.]
MKVVFFPNNEPNTIVTYVKLPEGTDVSATDSVANIIEKRIYGVIGDNNPNIESVVTNIARVHRINV